MQRYRNTSGQSGIVAYEIGDTDITVRFGNGGTYVYDYGSTGRREVETMKELARSGQGLSSFISRFVGEAYAARVA